MQKMFNKRDGLGKVEKNVVSHRLVAIKYLSKKNLTISTDELIKLNETEFITKDWIC